jgi:diguanylate cyclase (GGDEF)-like protein
LPNTVNAVIVMFVYFWVFKDSFTSNMQYYWISTILLLLIIRLFLYLKSLKVSSIVRPRRWLYFYSILLFCLGCAWGSIIFIPIDPGANALITVSTVTLLLVLSGISAISSAAHPAAIWAFIIPISSFAAYNLTMSTSEDFGVIFGLCAVVYCVSVGLVGHTINKTIVNALYLQNRNSSLMDEVVQIAKQNQKSYEGFQVLLDNLGAGAAMFDRNYKIVSWNKSFENIFHMPTGLIKMGMSLKEVIRKIIKQSWQNNVDVNHAADVHINELLSDTDENEMIKLLLADGRNLYSKVMKINEDQMVLNYTDVTSLERARADDVIHVLQHDSLTGLPNQVLHKKEIRRRIEDFVKNTASENTDQNVQFMGLIHFGINSLNEIYEFLGLSAGDQVVTEVAQRCKNFLSDDVHLSHVAYDEFQIITNHEKNIDEVLELIEALNTVISEPIDLGGNKITMTASYGITVFPDHADQSDILKRNAKIAFNKAKLPSGESIVVYDHGMHLEIMERTNMLFDIRDSISKSQFMLHYQPQIDIKSNQITGVEALLRWQHPDKGWISPVDFIPIAEHTKQIIPLTEQFLPEACRQAKKWQDQGLPHMKMSVNISPFHFHEKGFTQFVRSCFEDAELDPSYLDLEITEGVIMNQTEEIINILHELSDMGVGLSIDDFGTGYSSLSYLRRLPVDKLKIDQSFTMDMMKDESSLSLVEAVIRMGHSFNLNVIAEGVETEEQLTRLLSMKCDQAQGFFIKRPDDADNITQWLKEKYT